MYAIYEFNESELDDELTKVHKLLGYTISQTELNKMKIDRFESACSDFGYTKEELIIIKEKKNDVKKVLINIIEEIIRR